MKNDVKKNDNQTQREVITQSIIKGTAEQCRMTTTTESNRVTRDAALTETELSQHSTLSLKVDLKQVFPKLFSVIKLNGYVPRSQPLTAMVG